MSTFRPLSFSLSLSLSLSLIELFTLSLLSHIVRHDLTHLISYSYFPLFSIWSCLTWRREYNISVMALGQFSLPPPLPMLASRPPPHLQDFQLFKKCFKKLGQPRPLFCCFSLFFQTQISQKITVGFSAIRTWIVGVEGKAHWPLDLHHGQSSVLLCSKINYWLNQTSKKIDRSPGNINFYARNKKEFFSAQLQKQMALMCHEDDEEEDDGDGYEDGGRRRLKLKW